MRDYAEFLTRKSQLADSGGFEPVDLPTHLFDYQTNLVEWASEVYAAVQMGRFAIGAELKPSYYEQAVRNLAAVDGEQSEDCEPSLFDEASV